MNVVKSLFNNSLRNLKPFQREGYFIRDNNGNKLIIKIDTKYTQTRMAKLYEIFNSCMFYNIDLVVEECSSYIECSFLNLSILNYNPYWDLYLIKFLNISLNMVKIQTIKNEFYNLESIIIRPNSHISSLVKYELLALIEKVVMKFLTHYEINGYLRLALYETETANIKVDMKLFTSDTQKNELYMDELYFFY